LAAAGPIADIATHAAGARVRPDVKVVRFDAWETPQGRLKAPPELYARTFRSPSARMQRDAFFLLPRGVGGG
jgi:hypothetical protein